MTDDEPQQTDWEKSVGLSEETAYVVIYPNRTHAEEWMDEADEKGYSSRSKYLYELIQEARAARAEGFLAYSQNESKVEELQLQVEQLQDELEDARNSEPGQIDIEHEEFVTAFLTERYQEFETILKEITGSGVLTGIVKDAIEEQLYDLAGEGKVEYKQGYGWRLARDNTDAEAIEA